MEKWKSGKVGSKLAKAVIFPEKSGAIVPILPWKERSPPLHILDTNYHPFYLKHPRKCQKIYNFDIFQHFPKFAPLPLLNFGLNPKFDHNPLCVYC